MKLRLISTQVKVEVEDWVELGNKKPVPKIDQYGFKFKNFIGFDIFFSKFVQVASITEIMIVSLYIN